MEIIAYSTCFKVSVAMVTDILLKMLLDTHLVYSDIKYIWFIGDNIFTKVNIFKLKC